ncbi:hypothetical protein D3C76_1064200 [compost metagenome]
MRIDEMFGLHGQAVVPAGLPILFCISLELVHEAHELFLKFLQRLRCLGQAGEPILIIFFPAGLNRGGQGQHRLIHPFDERLGKLRHVPLAKPHLPQFAEDLR